MKLSITNYSKLLFTLALLLLTSNIQAEEGFITGYSKPNFQGPNKFQYKVGTYEFIKDQFSLRSNCELVCKSYPAGIPPILSFKVPAGMILTIITKFHKTDFVGILTHNRASNLKLSDKKYQTTVAKRFKTDAPCVDSLFNSFDYISIKIVVSRVERSALDLLAYELLTKMYIYQEAYVQHYVLKEKTELQLTDKEAANIKFAVNEEVKRRDGMRRSQLEANGDISEADKKLLESMGDNIATDPEEELTSYIADKLRTQKEQVKAEKRNNENRLGQLKAEFTRAFEEVEEFAQEKIEESETGIDGPNMANAMKDTITDSQTRRFVVKKEEKNIDIKNLTPKRLYDALYNDIMEFKALRLTKINEKLNGNEKLEFKGQLKDELKESMDKYIKENTQTSVEDQKDEFEFIYNHAGVEFKDVSKKEAEAMCRIVNKESFQTKPRALSLDAIKDMEMPKRPAWDI